LTVSYTITNTGTREGAEASQAYVTLPSAADEPFKRLVGFQKVDLMPGASQPVSVVIDSAAPNHPLSYFQPDPKGTWADGHWRMAQGAYNVQVGTSSANTPLQATVNLKVAAPPIRLRLVPRVLDLRGRSSPVTAELRVRAPYTLSDLKITNVSLEGVRALSTALSSDQRTMVATFDRTRLSQLTAGENVVVSLAADIVRNGTEDRLWATTTARVLR